MQGKNTSRQLSKGKESPQAINLASLVGLLRSTVETLPDKRKGRNTQYKLSDAALSAFSVFFMQSPSFLAHQRQMTQRKGKDNVQSLFQAEAIPSDNQIRNILDPIAPGAMTLVFEQVFQAIHHQGYLDDYRSINGTLLLALDGTQYFSSNTIHCNQCLQTTHRKKDDTTTVTYSHCAVTPALVAPNHPQVICLPPEFIHQQDGETKQDCEQNAAKRWLQIHGHQYQSLGVTLLADDLYSHQPMIQQIKAEGFHYILTCKPTSHIAMYQWLAGLDKLNKVSTFSVNRHQGKKRFTDTYRFANNVPLRNGQDTIEVNWCELVTHNEKGEITYSNAYATDHAITKENCTEVVAAGRTRWKIENEHNNTLKTKGYHLEHNFGHGKTHLSELLLTLNIIAFLFHTVLHLHDSHYQAIRAELGSRKTFFQHVRTLTYYQYFKSWTELMEFMVVGLEIDLFPDTS